MEQTTTYFEMFGPANTPVTFGLVRERLRTGGIGTIVLASTTGATARGAMEFFRDDDVRLVVVPHQYDFHRDGNLFPQDLVRDLVGAGHAVHFSTMLFHTDGLYASNAPTLMANLLRCFSQGVKVCFECVLMAADGGHLASGERVIAVAGTGRGSDTALVMQAASSQHLERLRVNELICKPLNPLNIEELRKQMGR